MPITDTYLSQPDQFPEPSDCPPWGDHDLLIDFVGGPYHVTGLNREQAEQLQDRFADICLGRTTRFGDWVTIHARRAPATLYDVRRPVPIARSFDLDPTADRVRIAGENMCGLIELDNRIAGYLWTPAQDTRYEKSIFENYLRIFVTYRLLQAGGMLLHSAGIVSGGHAFLFPGRSGDGKSTLSRISLEHGRTVLSDDLNALTWHSGRPFLEKVPFSGDLGRTPAPSGRFPLRGIFALRKSGKTALHPLPKSRALSLLAASAPFLNADLYRLPELLNQLYKLTLAVPTHTIEFNLTDNPWTVLDHALSGPDLAATKPVVDELNP